MLLSLIMTFYELVSRSKSGTTSPNLSRTTTREEHNVVPPWNLLKLPPEVIDQIFSHLECPSLVSLSRASKRLATHAENDLLWATLLRAQLPTADFPESPYPADSYRSLYIAHHPYWYLARRKLWFSNEPHTGKIILVKFDPRRGCIEGYRIVAERGEPNLTTWSHNPEVIIHTFEPRPSLWLGDPVLRLEQDPQTAKSRQGWWDGEIKMKAGGSSHNTFSTFFLSRAIPDQLLDKSMELWPPLTIPGMPRVRSASQDNFQGWGHKPQRFDEISDTTFRLRQWTQFRVGGANFGVRMGDNVSTWSTLDPKLYTPTKEKPYQGIFIGDYSGHGCEFLLIMQTDKAPDPPPPNLDSQFYQAGQIAALANAMRSGSDSDYSMANRQAQPTDTMHQGALEAIKLTGDPNVPRGEHTFIADDIGAAGFIRVASEVPFTGARVVKSRGHVAERGFQNDEFVPSQLILMSPDKLAHYWLPFGHISYYERVDIDGLLKSCVE